MPRRVTPSQLRSMIRQSEQKQRQVISRYNSMARRWNRGVDNFNRDLKRAVDDNNRKVRAHNSRARANRQRLRSELAKLRNSTSRSRFPSLRASVQILCQAFVNIEEKVEAGAWVAPGELLELTEREAANSIEVVNALLAEPGDSVAFLPELQETSLTHELTDISPELDERWRGALFALDPKARARRTTPLP